MLEYHTVQYPMFGIYDYFFLYYFNQNVTKFTSASEVESWIHIRSCKKGSKLVWEQVYSLAKRIGVPNDFFQLSELLLCSFAVDVSGGYHPSVFHALRSSISVSKTLQFGKKEEDHASISHHEAFFMATLGGAQGEWGGMIFAL